MSLFSSDNILLNESSIKDMDIDAIGYLDTDINNYSFVQEGYNAILEMNADLISADRTFFECVLGSHGDDYIINESFSDFFDKVKAIIRKFIDWIKKVFKEFITKINALISSEKYIKKHHKLLNKFDSEDEFEYKGYKFSHVEDTQSYPSASAVASIDSATTGAGMLSTDYDPWANYEKITAGSDTDKAAQTTLMNDKIAADTKALEDSLDDFYDKFRADTIGKSGEKIYSSDFANELFMVFRSGDDTPIDITIDSSEVLACYRRFDGHKDLIKAIEKNQKNIIKEYEALEKYLDKMITMKKAGDAFNYSDYSANAYVKQNIDVLTKDTDTKSIKGKTIYSTSTTDKMNNYLKVLSNKTSQMCQIHTQAFSAKLEAAKDMFKQDKAIIYKALQKIIKRTGGKE